MIVKEENEIKLIASEKEQAKLLASLQGTSSEELIKSIKATFGLGSYSVIPSATTIVIDEYFDTDDMALHEMRASLRVRQENEKMSVTVKKFVEQERGRFKRLELSRDIDKLGYMHLLNSGFLQILNNEWPELKDDPVSKILEIRNERTTFSIRRDQEEYALSFDLFAFIDPNTNGTSEKQSEIEIEALSDAAAVNLGNIRRNLVDVVKTFSYSKASKYDRGVEYFSLNRRHSTRPCVFIGHGRSSLWARLQVFLEKDLRLRIVSYESESRIGESIVPILKDMLDQASFAILILTAEDETSDGNRRARQNVIHEAGLFQGRLGFEKVVLLRQDGLEDFSNVDGLQYVSFSGDRIEHTFWEIQRFLKREGILA